ncbi:MAG TPA: hypothetical protein VG410_11845 [Solirubrobacteraceae bacterium]|nr:hypothetical protein [Solirubrobacteraceae bacterium]
MTTALNQLTVLDDIAMQVIDSLAHLCDAAAADLRRQVPELEHVDPAAIGGLRRGIEQSYRELCSLIRSDVPVAGTPPVGGLENAIGLRDAGLGWAAAHSALRTSLVLFRRVAASMARPAAAPEIDELLSEYWIELVTALGDGYQRVRGDAVEPLGFDEPLRDPPGAPATDAYLAERAVDAGLAARVRARNEAIIEDFCEALEAAATEPRIAAKLAGADTSVAIVLADEDGVAATLMFDRDPIGIERGPGSTPEATITITGADLQRLGAEEFHLAMAMARGRVGWSGPVRKFLRLAPVVEGILGRSAQNDDFDADGRSDDAP